MLKEALIQNVAVVVCGFVVGGGFCAFVPY